MIKTMFWMLVAGLVVGCAIEEQQSSGALTVDPNSDTVVPEGLTARDVDLNNDGTVNIQDLVIVSKLFGDVEAEEETMEVIAESCPVGEYRVPIVKYDYVGFDPIVESTRYSYEVSNSKIGRRLKTPHGYETFYYEDKREESCDYLYPETHSKELQNIYISRSLRAGIESPEFPNSTCLIHCPNNIGIESGEIRNSIVDHQKEGSLQFMLCKQKYEIVGYTKCYKCPQIVNKSGDKSYLPTKIFKEFVQSDDPTKCQHNGQLEKKYIFPHSNGNDFYTYAYVKMERYYPNPSWTPDNFINPEYNPLGRRTHSRSTHTLLRFLLSPDKDNRIKELTVITLVPGIDVPGKQVHTFNIRREPNPIKGFSYDRYISTNSKIVEILVQNDDAKLENMGHPLFPTPLDTTNNILNDRLSQKHFYKAVNGMKIPIRGGIQIGEPSEIVDDKSNSSVVAIHFKHPLDLGEFRWGVYDHGFRWTEDIIFPEDVRSNKVFWSRFFPPEE